MGRRWSAGGRMGGGVGAFRRRNAGVCVRICWRGCGHMRWYVSAWVWVLARGACVGVGGCVVVKFQVFLSSGFEVLSF